MYILCVLIFNFSRILSKKHRRLSYRDQIVVLLGLTMYDRSLEGREERAGGKRTWNIIVSFYILGSQEGPLEVDGTEVWTCYLRLQG